jgi:hypothetical protein
VVCVCVCIVCVGCVYCVAVCVLFSFNVVNSRTQDALDEQNKRFHTTNQHFPSQAKRLLRASVYRATREHCIGETAGDDVRVHD